MIVKVYRYGLLPPTEGAERISEQIWRAHRYQNALIEIERRRRERLATVVAEDATVTEARTALDALDAERQAILESCPRTAKGRRTVSPETRAQLAALTMRQREARATLRAAKAASRTDPDRAARLAAIADDERGSVRAARKLSDLYWGTYLLIEQAMDLARRSPEPPRFRRWTGEGAVAVQIQHGMTTAELLAGADRRLQIDQRLQPVPGRGGKARPRVRLRLGTDADGDPIWGEWPVILHRPLPDDARIKWAKVVRRRVCGKDEWSLHLTVRLQAPAARTGDRVVAVDLGWRRLEEGILRAGGWTDGDTGADVLVPASAVARLRKADDIRAIRDRHLNAIRATLTEWREATEMLPASHVEVLRWLPAWRSPARFAALARWWRDHRTVGDETVVAALETWRARDRHLWLYETGCRRGALAHRREVYRQLAAQLARTADVLVIERLDLRGLATIPGPDSERESHPRARAQRQAVAPSELRDACVQAVQARGGRVVTVAPTGPAASLLAAYRERSGVADLPGTAREARFARVRARIAAQQAGAAAPSEGADDGALA